MLLWLLGYPDQALEQSQQSLALARELSHPYTLTHALYYSAWVHQQRGESRAVMELIEAAIALARDQGLRRWVLQGAVLQGWLLTEQGKREDGIRQMREAATAMGAERSYCVALLCEAHRTEGQIEEGLTAICSHLTHVNKTGERFYESELHRIQGELLLLQAASDKDQAESYFWEAIKLARSQSAKSLELRAAMSLSRLWQQQRRIADARQLMTDIYGWFTEGFDTADLKAAKTILEELS